MGPDQMHALLRAEPYHPLRVTLTNGTAYDLFNPNLCQSTECVFVVGIPYPRVSWKAKEIVWINWPDIASVVALAS